MKYEITYRAVVEVDEQHPTSPKLAAASLRDAIARASDEIKGSFERPYDGLRPIGLDLSIREIDGLLG